MEKVVVEQLAERISALLREKLGARGSSLEARVQWAGRGLPRRVRQAAMELVNAERMAQDPKMRLRLDPQQVSAAYNTCLTHLDAIDAKAMKAKRIFGFLATLIIQIVLIGAAAVALLRWRGFL